MIIGHEPNLGFFIYTWSLDGKAERVSPYMDCVEYADELCTVLNRWEEQIVADLQYKIDELMLEYCPTLMTWKQLKNWAEHQA